MASIAKRPNGKWRARYRDEANKEHSRHFDRKVDAQRWLDHVTTSVITGTYVDPKAGNVTLRQFYDDWAKRQVWVSGTVKAMNLAVYSTTFADTPMGKIRPSHIQTWVKQMDATLAASTIKTRFNNVRAVFAAAKFDKVIGTDPTEKTKLPRLRRPEAAMSIPTPEQVGKILVAADPYFKTFIGLCAFAGLRLGEAAAIQVGDVDFLRRQLEVQRQVQRAGNREVEIRAPKYGSERTIYLADDLVTMLAQHVENIGVSVDGWLFRGQGSNPPHQNTVGYWWRKTLAAADVDGVRLHDLRHFYASGLIAAGCDVVTVQRSLGHKSATVTLNTYSHLWPTAEDRTRKAAQGIMGAVMNPAADCLRTDGGINPV
jgi:integrase